MIPLADCDTDPIPRRFRAGVQAEERNPLFLGTDKTWLVTRAGRVDEEHR